MLLPEEGGEESLLGSPASTHRQRGSAAARGTAAGREGAGGQDEGEGEEEMVPVSAQVQARLEGLCLQLDTFDCSSSSSSPGEQQEQEGVGTQTRVALVVRHLEVRDSFQLRQGGGAAPGAAATGWSDLRRMLGYHASVHRMRGAKACMLQVAVEGIRSELGAGKHAGRAGRAALAGCACHAGAQWTWTGACGLGSDELQHRIS